VAAEIIFDRGWATCSSSARGHIVDNGVLGSIEFGVDVLDVPLCRPRPRRLRAVGPPWAQAPG